METSVHPQIGVQDSISSLFCRKSYLNPGSVVARTCRLGNGRILSQHLHVSLPEVRQIMPSQYRPEEHLYCCFTSPNGSVATSLVASDFGTAIEGRGPGSGHHAWTRDERSGAVHARVFGVRQFLKYRPNNILQLAKALDVLLELPIGLNKPLR